MTRKVLYKHSPGFWRVLWGAFQLYPVDNPTEKLYRVQFPTGMGYFRPDLNFEGTSEREIEVRTMTVMVK